MNDNEYTIYLNSDPSKIPIRKLLVLNVHNREEKHLKTNELKSHFKNLENRDMINSKKIRGRSK